MNSSFFTAGLRVGENGLLGGTIADFVVVSFWVCRVGAGLGFNLKLLVVVGLLNELVVGLLVDLVVVLEVVLVVERVVGREVVLEVGLVSCFTLVSTSCCLLCVNFVIACILFSSSSSLTGASSRMKRVNLCIACKTSVGTTSEEVSWAARNSDRVITAAHTMGEDLTLPASSFCSTAFVASSTTFAWLSLT